MSKFCSCGWPYLETDELIIHFGSGAHSALNNGSDSQEGHDDKV